MFQLPKKLPVRIRRHSRGIAEFIVGRVAVVVAPALGADCVAGCLEK
jgi:hypothetical protein